MYFYSFTFFFKLSSTNLLNAQSTKHGKSTLTISFLFYFFGALGSPHGFLFALLLCPTLVKFSITTPTNIFKTKKPTSKRNEMKYRSIHSLWFSCGCISTPTASIPVYIICTQPSLLERTKSAMSALPRLSKLYWVLSHWLRGSARQSAFVFTSSMSTPTQ